MYFNIKCIGKLPGPTNKFERSLVFEIGEFERPKFDCTTLLEITSQLIFKLIDKETIKIYTQKEKNAEDNYCARFATHSHHCCREA